jgi:hypothetical protein
VTFTKHPSAAAGHEVVATVEAAAKFTSDGASGELMGQVAPAIAATEAQYGEMWAQDAAAMYGYAGPSTAKSTAEQRQGIQGAQGIGEKEGHHEPVARRSRPGRRERIAHTFRCSEKCAGDVSARQQLLTTGGRQRSGASIVFL